MLDIFGGRPAEDVLSRVCRVTLGGKEYELTVLTIAGNKRWKATLDNRLAGLLDGLAGAPNRGAVLEALATQTDDLIDLLVAYDTDGGARTGVLPDAAGIAEVAYEHELVTAVREVWRAANPFVMAGIRQAQAAEALATAAVPASA